MESISGVPHLGQGEGDIGKGEALVNRGTNSDHPILSCSLATINLSAHDASLSVHQGCPWQEIPEVQPPHRQWLLSAAAEQPATFQSMSGQDSK